jgi:HTH-type transcriptional regulator / antitoxin HigA
METDYKTPGQLIEALLTERGWTQRVLALVLGMSESALNKVVSGKQSLTAEIALSLEEVFGVDADKFLSLQKHYDLARARLTSRPDPKRSTRAQLFGGLPVAEMVKRGWLAVADSRNIEEVESALAKFFGVETVEEIEVLPHAAKKTQVAAGTTPAQLAWLYRVRQIASETLVAQFSPFSARRAVERLRELVLSAEEVRKVPRILAESGIRFVIVEALPASKIDGVCFWLDDASPVIAMSFRFDRIDNFWFVLRHELEHVIQGHGRERITIDADLDGDHSGDGADVEDQEHIANAAAAEFCVPKKSMDSFIARKAPFFAERDILGMAATLKVHPGLVAGQLRRRTNRYDRFGSHLVKVRSIVAPSAIVDGWGDVAPVGE